MADFYKLKSRVTVPSIPGLKTGPHAKSQNRHGNGLRQAKIAYGSSPTAAAAPRTGCGHLPAGNTPQLPTANSQSPTARLPTACGRTRRRKTSENQKPPKHKHSLPEPPNTSITPPTSPKYPRHTQNTKKRKKGHKTHNPTYQHLTRTGPNRARVSHPPPLMEFRPRNSYLKSQKGKDSAASCSPRSPRFPPRTDHSAKRL